jgi:Zn finger protein HypA/HybF involved in hydrogenase expression
MKETYDKAVDFISGETVVGGRYECAECGHALEIDDGKVTNLPVCPDCQSHHWKPA